MLVFTLAAAVDRWPDPHGFAALCAGALRQRGIRTLIFDLAPAVHRISTHLQRPPGARETTYLPGTGLHLYRPQDGLTVLVPGAAGPSAAAASLSRVINSGREGGYGALVLCCALDQGNWVKEVVAAAHTVLVVTDADAKHALAVRRSLPVTAAPVHLVIAAGRQPGEGKGEEPEELAAAMRLPLLTALLPGADPEASERATLHALDQVRRGLEEPAELPAPAVAAVGAQPAAAAPLPPPLVAAAAPAAAAPAPVGPAPVATPDAAPAAPPPVAPQPAEPEAAAGRLPARGAVQVPVPEEALPLVLAALAVWEIQSHWEARRGRMHDMAEALRRTAGGLQSHLLPDAGGDGNAADLLKELEAALQLKQELRQLRSDEAADAARCGEAVDALDELLAWARQCAAHVA